MGHVAAVRVPHLQPGESNSMSAPWYVLHTKPRKERWVWEELCRRGIDSYFPRLRLSERNRWQPYFPRYLFVRFADVTAELQRCRWMPNTIGLVHLGGEPATISDGTLNQLRRRIEEDHATLGEHRTREFKAGDPVQICGGLFEGYEGLFDRYMSCEERVQVLMRMLGDRMLRVDVTVRNVRVSKMVPAG